MSEWSSELGKSLVAAFSEHGGDHETTLELFNKVYETGARMQSQDGLHYLASLSQKMNRAGDINLDKIGALVNTASGFPMWYERKVSDANWQARRKSAQSLVAHN